MDLKRNEVPIVKYDPQKKYPEGTVIVWNDEDFDKETRFDVPEFLKTETTKEEQDG